jgi:hypothetical protein
MLAAVAALLTTLTALPSAAQAPSSEAPRMGGVLKAAMIGEPPSLDLHVQGFEPGPYMHFWNVWLDKR